VRWLSPAGATLFHDDFYDREDLCQQFENWIRYLALRYNPLTGRLYRDEPAILAWELANEPRCHSDRGLPARGDCVSSGRILSWIKRMSATLKNCDPNHLVAVGDEGFFKRSASSNFLYDGSSGIDAEELLEVPSIDFGTFHLFPQAWNQNREFGKSWIQQHLRLARQAGKPMLLEEFGVSLGDGFVADAADRDSLYSDWLAAVAAEGGAGTLFWMLAGVGPDGQRFQNADRFCLFDGKDVPSIVVNAQNVTGNGGLVSA
jgi:endo-1,4-beta-mannosidase